MYKFTNLPYILLVNWTVGKERLQEKLPMLLMIIHFHKLN